MSETKNNLQFKDDKLHLEDEVVMKKVSGIPVNQEDETGTIDVDANINIGGSASINGDVIVKGSVTIEGTSYKVIENPEYVWAIIDNDDKILCGIKTDGKFVADIDGIDEKLQEAINQMQTIIDEAQASIDEKITAIDEKFDFISWIEDPEGRSEVTTDSEGKIISYRDSEGVKHEEVGFESPIVNTNSLNLTTDGMTEFQKALKDSGFSGGSGDWSYNKSLEIPMPRCAIVNITNDTNNAIWPTSKTVDYHYYLQFWDMQGNYFKKPVIYNAQGNSSLGMPKKNAGFDIFADGWDGESFTLKIGSWVPQDSFHLKAYYADYFVGVCLIGYRLFDQITATRDIFTNRDWKKALIPDKATIGTGCRAMDGEDDKYSLDNDARCFPDGFPCIVYLNGEFYGVYSWQLKKHRDNYMMSKKKPKHIHLDGVINNLRLFGANGDSSKIGWVDEGDTGFEIRNPKPKKKKDGWDLTCIDGTKYDADTNMKEIIGQDNPLYDSTNESHVKTNQTKQAILQLSTYITELNQMESDGATSEAIRLRLSEMFDIQSFIDYLVFGDVTANFDGFAKNWQWITYNGNKWFVEPYDLDGIFGWSGWAEISSNDGRYGNDKSIPSGWIIQYYQTELEARYAELRQNGIFTRNSILRIFRDWIAAIGTDNYQKNHDKWPIDKEHYYAAPEKEHFDNIYRLSNWLDERIAKCDEIYNYNQN